MTEWGLLSLPPQTAIGSATSGLDAGAVSGWEKVPRVQSAMDIDLSDSIWKTRVTLGKSTCSGERRDAAIRHRVHVSARCPVDTTLSSGVDEACGKRTPDPWTCDCGRWLDLAETSRCWGPTETLPASCGPQAGPSLSSLPGLVRHSLPLCLICLLPAHQPLRALGCMLGPQEGVTCRGRHQSTQNTLLLLGSFSMTAGCT